MSIAEPSWRSDFLSPEKIALVRQHLKDVIASHGFAGSKRAQDFLQLIVEHTLEGNVDSLRERMIGAEMFGRPIDYDTGSDAVVRVKANEIRKKLAQYYFETDGKCAVRIELPSGSYVPKFIFEPLKSVTQPQPSVVPYVSVQQSIAPGGTSHVDMPATSVVGITPPPTRKLRFTPRITAGTAIGLAALAVIGYLGFKTWHSDSHALAGIRSIAVLPLKNLSGDPNQEYFADGMTEELINDLGQVSTLRVISLTSSMSYKGTTKKLPDIARELAVNGLVEGGVLRDGNQLRISAQLIDARTDRPIWAHTYVRDLADARPWQGEVAQAITDEISINLPPKEQARLARNRPVDPQAQDQYLHGIQHSNADDCKTAVAYFRAALDKKPDFAQAHAALAECYGRMGEEGQLSYKEAFSTQKAEASRAIELDESLPEGHAELANAAMTLDWDWTTAATEFRRALELNPNSASTHQKYAFYLLRTGHQPEALAEVERGLDLDPVSGRSFHFEGFIYYFSRQYDQALSLIRRGLELDINPPSWSFLTGDIDAEKGMYAESIREFMKSGSGPYALGHMGNAYARAGQVDAALKTIETLQEHLKKDGVGRYEIALVYAGLGKKKEAFKWLEESYSARDVGLLYLKVDPPLDPLRDDPRFDDLVRRVGLTK